ncbi:hypothetical protein GALMADRAFT_462969 [Galerina marginata CBS 339.88]|uniref:Uncharacterized protein n=1 Tax=Galerina marginata (strain CBS 339.88) TaxID=685588 RepID=A0A067T1E5_GALM3|nr:hypothetical protein GALMADRAFT_462969 [Galerina marginata CBS 339.88]
MGVPKYKCRVFPLPPSFSREYKTKCTLQTARCRNNGISVSRLNGIKLCEVFKSDLGLGGHLPFPGFFLFPVVGLAGASGGGGSEVLFDNFAYRAQVFVVFDLFLSIAACAAASFAAWS